MYHLLYYPQNGSCRPHHTVAITGEGKTEGSFVESIYPANSRFKSFIDRDYAGAVNIESPYCKILSSHESYGDLVSSHPEIYTNEAVSNIREKQYPYK